MSFVMAKAPRSAGKRLLAAVLTAASLALVTIAQRDLHRRPEAQVRGDKRLWRLVCLNAFGAVGYLLWGRQQT